MTYTGYPDLDAKLLILYEAQVMLEHKGCDTGEVTKDQDDLILSGKIRDRMAQ